MNITAKRRRSIWIWVIAVFYFCTGVMTFLTFVHILYTPVDTGMTDITAVRGQLKLWTLYGLLPLANIAAAIAIFQMRRIAFALFTGILAARLAVVSMQFLLFDLASELIAGPGLTGAILGFGINGLVCVYTYHLRKNGRLV